MHSLWMVLASLLFALMGACVKLGAGRYSPAELVFYRGFVSLVLLYAFIRFRRLPLATVHWRAHGARGVSGFFSLVAYFYAISKLPLATAVTLNYTSPLFLAVILVAWARERLRPALVAAVLVGFVGVALLLRPSFAQSQILAGLMAVASGLFAAMAYYNVRQLGGLGEPEWRVVFYFSLLSALGGLAWVLGAGGFRAVDGEGALLLLGVGGFGALAQLAMTRAYRHGKTLATAGLAYSTVVFSSLIGVLLWGETLPLPSWLAVALIVASGVLASYWSRAEPTEQD